MKYEAILFDLDGTLIGLDIERFLPAYMKEIQGWVARKMDPVPFMKRFEVAVGAMLDDDTPHLTNEQVFFEALLPGLPQVTRDDCQEMFDAFYTEVFPGLAHHCNEVRDARMVINRLRKAKCRLVLATNPVFPRPAVKQRLEWGALNPGDFEHITSYENSRYCKPRPGYYRDILNLLDLEAEDVLMVGNDRGEDLAAGELGIDTYLVDGYIIERPGVDLQPDYQGDMRDILHVVGLD